MNPPDLKIIFTWAEGADRSLSQPSYETIGAAGADVRANFVEAEREGLLLKPGQRGLVQAGIHMAIPQGFEIQVRPRSGLALKHGVTLVNTPGTIDSDYRGPLGILMINLGENDFHITHGMRVAQLVVAPVLQAEFRLVETLDETERGQGGFGSTGTGA